MISTEVEGRMRNLNHGIDGDDTISNLRASSRMLASSRRRLGHDLLKISCSSHAPLKFDYAHIIISLQEQEQIIVKIKNPAFSLHR